MLESWAVARSQAKKAVAMWAYEGRNLRGAACIRALNESEAQSIRAFGLRNPIAVIPNGVDLPTIDADAARQSAKLLPGRQVLLYLGRLHPKKGLVNLLHAWAELAAHRDTRTRVDGWTLVIAGWDQEDHERQLLDVSKQLCLGADRVLFVGPQFGTDKAMWYLRCDAFILPSLSEGLPMVVLEAWAYGKPVICTPQCNLPLGVKSGAAISADPCAASLLAALKSLTSMYEAERVAMGARGICLVAEHFAWPKIAATMCDVDRWILGGGNAPDSVLID
jgi:poly(glycerol-phosphate) alpha-glucosyltransferase